MFTSFKNKASLARVAIVSAAMGLAATAHAELPPEAASAIGDYKVDALAAIALVMTAGVAIWGLKKLATKLGWF